MKVKIIFDKDAVNKDLRTGWGISYLVGDNVLFDVAEKGEYLLNNLKVLGIDIKKIEKVVISHNHWDHRAGLWDLLKVKSDIIIYACSDFIEEFKDKLKSYKVKKVDGFEEIAKDIYTTGCFNVLYKDKNLMEQSLIVRSDKGISLLCGCSHPGILEIINKAKELFPKEKIYSYIGGFHLMDKEPRFIRYIGQKIKEAGIEALGPSHCSGFKAASILGELLKGKLFEVKVGAEIIV